MIDLDPKTAGNLFFGFIGALIAFVKKVSDSLPNYNRVNFMLDLVLYFVSGITAAYFAGWLSMEWGLSPVQMSINAWAGGAAGTKMTELAIARMNSVLEAAGGKGK